MCASVGYCSNVGYCSAFLTMFILAFLEIQAADGISDCTGSCRVNSPETIVCRPFIPADVMNCHRRHTCASHLDLSGTNISSFVGLNSLRGITTIRLDGTSIRRTRIDAFSGFPDLKTVYARHLRTSLSDLLPALLGLKPGSEVYLAGNGNGCTCKGLEIRSSFRRKNISVADQTGSSLCSLEVKTRCSNLIRFRRKRQNGEGRSGNPVYDPSDKYPDAGNPESRRPSKVGNTDGRKNSNVDKQNFGDPNEKPDAGQRNYGNSNDGYSVENPKDGNPNEKRPNVGNPNAGFPAKFPNAGNPNAGFPAKFPNAGNPKDQNVNDGKMSDDGSTEKTTVGGRVCRPLPWYKDPNTRVSTVMLAIAILLFVIYFIPSCTHMCRKKKADENVNNNLEGSGIKNDNKNAQDGGAKHWTNNEWEGLLGVPQHGGEHNTESLREAAGNGVYERGDGGFETVQAEERELLRSVPTAVGRKVDGKSGVVLDGIDYVDDSSMLGCSPGKEERKGARRSIVGKIMKEIGKRSKKLKGIDWRKKKVKQGSLVDDGNTGRSRVDEENTNRSNRKRGHYNAIDNYKAFSDDNDDADDVNDRCRDYDDEAGDDYNIDLISGLIDQRRKCLGVPMYSFVDISISSSDSEFQWRHSSTSASTRPTSGVTRNSGAPGQNI